jgi:16S rRNA (cytidine1402-2'-O)-methyltransferase
LEDITLRVLRVLREVDLIAAEDTRHTAKLLNRYEIKTPTTSYHENNKDSKGPYLLQRLKSGDSIALVSDSGMPCVSDPGWELVALCHAAKITVTVCPGASAGLSALALSGFNTRPHVFEGFLPRGGSARKKVLAALANEPRTMVFYEAPHRLLTTLNDLAQVLGDREMALAREITKKFEEVTHGKIPEIAALYKDKTPKGEFVLIIKGTQDLQADYPEDLIEHLEQYIAQGLNEKEAMKKVASDRGLAKSQIYNQLKAKI